MSLKDFFKANHLNKLLIVFAVAVILVFVFTLGVFTGHEKGRFSCRWGENYFRNVMGPAGPGRPGGFGMMDFGRPGFNARGGFGEIMKIEGDNLIVRGQDNVEKVIVVGSRTVIRRRNQNLKLSDLKIDDEIVVIGRPDNQGRVEASLIRVMPAPVFNDETGGAATSTEQQ